MSFNHFKGIFNFKESKTDPAIEGNLTTVSCNKQKEFYCGIQTGENLKSVAEVSSGRQQLFFCSKNSFWDSKFFVS